LEQGGNPHVEFFKPSRLNGTATDVAACQVTAQGVTQSLAMFDIFIAQVA